MSERRNLVVAIVVALVLGLAGGTIGTLATIAATHHGRGPFLGGDRHPGRRGEDRQRRGPRRPRMENVLDRQLDLSDAQRAEIEEILDAARPRYAAVRESTRAEIDRVLTDEQRTKLRELEERFPARRRDRGTAP